MQDELWFLKHQSKTLQEFRTEIRPLWADEAARDLDIRYLNGHADDDHQMLQAFQMQAEAIENARIHLEIADQVVLLVEAQTLELHEHVELSAQEVHTGYQFYEQYRDYEVRTLDLFQDVESLIREAYSVCEGVPKT